MKMTFYNGQGVGIRWDTEASYNKWNMIGPSRVVVEVKGSVQVTIYVRGAVIMGKVCWVGTELVTWLVCGKTSPMLNEKMEHRISLHTRRYSVIKK